MRNPAYLALSRHGIFYFRYPVHRGATLKLSLQTRVPSLALKLAGALAVIASDEIDRLAQGHIGIGEPRALMAKHFESSRAKHREQVALRGPRVEEELETFERLVQSYDRGNLKSGWNDVHFEGYLADRQVPLSKGTSEYAELLAEHAEQFVVDKYISAALAQGATL
jgi:hypothetical protein